MQPETSESREYGPRRTRDPGGHQTIEPQSLGQLRLLTANGVELDVDGLQARVDGKIIHLTLKEFQLLHVMMDNAGRAMTRRQLLNEVWGLDYLDANKTLEVHILRIRRKLKPHRDSPERIRTVRGIGYIFDVTTW